MIKLSSQQIYFVQERSDEFSVSLDEIQVQLWESFLACGYADSWLVDDIVMALAAYVQKRPDSFKERSELLELLIKVLFDSGFGDVANHFQNHESYFTEELLRLRIHALLPEVVEELDSAVQADLVQAVKQVLELLPYSDESLRDSLIMELIRQESTENYPQLTLKSIAVVKKAQTWTVGSPLLPMQMLKKLPFSADLVDWPWEHISLHAGGYLFNSIKVNIHLKEIVRYCGEPSFELGFSEYITKLFQCVSSYLEKTLEEYLLFEETVDYLSIHNLGSESVFVGEASEVVRGDYLSSLDEFFVKACLKNVSKVKIDNN